MRVLVGTAHRIPDHVLSTCRSIVFVIVRKKMQMEQFDVAGLALQMAILRKTPLFEVAAHAALKKVCVSTSRILL
jgi:hypothetical protein